MTSSASGSLGWSPKVAISSWVLCSVDAFANKSRRGDQIIAGRISHKLLPDLASAAAINPPAQRLAQVGEPRAWSVDGYFVHCRLHRTNTYPGWQEQILRLKPQNDIS
jgi:hypothetical protein